MRRAIEVRFPYNKLESGRDVTLNLELIKIPPLMPIRLSHECVYLVRVLFCCSRRTTSLWLFFLASLRAVSPNYREIVAFHSLLYSSHGDCSYLWPQLLAVVSPPLSDLSTQQLTRLWFLAVCVGRDYHQ